MALCNKEDILYSLGLVLAEALQAVSKVIHIYNYTYARALIPIITFIYIKQP